MAHHTMFSHYSNMGPMTEVTELRTRLDALETRLSTEVAALCESVRELKDAVTELGADLETEVSWGHYERNQRKAKA